MDIPCPFCPGQESSTPPELFVLDDSNLWQLRVVPNMYPAVRPDSPAFGFHEVIIDCRDHLASPSELTDDQLANLFLAYRQRLIVHGKDDRIACVSIFKNVGAEAGASLAHAHSQLIALPFVPAALREELRPGPCAFCSMLRDEVRIVAESEQFVLACPYAPRFPYEMWLLPRNHESRFERENAFQELAGVMKRGLVALDRVLNSPAYNWWLHTAPREESPDFHWHFEIIPRLNRVAGFEWATGVFINDVLPERAAEILRDKLPL